MKKTEQYKKILGLTREGKVHADIHVADKCIAKHSITGSILNDL